MKDFVITHFYSPKKWEKANFFSTKMSVLGDLKDAPIDFFLFFSDIFPTSSWVTVWKYLSECVRGCPWHWAWIISKLIICAFLMWTSGQKQNPYTSIGLCKLTVCLFHTMVNLKVHILEYTHWRKSCLQTFFLRPVEAKDPSPLCVLLSSKFQLLSEQDD